jgi:protein required for attachment to host cells
VENVLMIGLVREFSGKITRATSDSTEETNDTFETETAAMIHKTAHARKFVTIIPPNLKTRPKIESFLDFVICAELLHDLIIAMYKQVIIMKITKLKQNM